MKNLISISLALVLCSCVSIHPGNDPVVVNAERTTALATDTFDTLVHIEYTNRAYLLTIDPQIKVYADKVRKNSPTWLKSARIMTESYKQHRDSQHKANLNTALAVLSTATDESQHYISASSK